MPNISVTYLDSKAKLNDKVYIGITADSEGQQISGLDVFLDISSHLKLLEYYPTSLMPVHNYQDHVGNLVRFSQLATGGTTLAVKGLIAVLVCQATTTGY